VSINVFVSKRKCKCTRFWTLDKHFNRTLDASQKMFLSNTSSFNITKISCINVCYNMTKFLKYLIKKSLWDAFGVVH